MTANHQIDKDSAPTIDLESLNHAQFAENLDSIFHVHLGNENVVDLKLIEVSALKDSARNERFSLLFLGPADFPLDQRMHAMDHDKIGSFTLFITTVGREEDGFLYEAIFNRLRKREPNRQT